jgi:hypothetical protein
VHELSALLFMLCSFWRDTAARAGSTVTNRVKLFASVCVVYGGLLVYSLIFSFGFTSPDGSSNGHQRGVTTVVDLSRAGVPRLLWRPAAAAQSAEG